MEGAESSCDHIFLPLELGTVELIVLNPRQMVRGTLMRLRLFYAAIGGVGLLLDRIAWSVLLFCELLHSSERRGCVVGAETVRQVSRRLWSCLATGAGGNRLVDLCRRKRPGVENHCFLRY